MSFFECRKDDRVYLKSDILDFDGKACHGFTTKLGGVSRGKIEGFNLGFRVNDDEESVRENYRLLALREMRETNGRMAMEEILNNYQRD